MQHINDVDVNVSEMRYIYCECEKSTTVQRVSLSIIQWGYTANCKPPAYAKQAGTGTGTEPVTLDGTFYITHTH